MMMMKKSCELCKSPARVHCESDQASLCWTCDRKVHSANFLVARHSRSLLCRVCQSPTPWTAAGEKLPASAVSVCEKCVVVDRSVENDENGENEADDENQVVPLSYTAPPAVSCSSSDECSVGDRAGSVKRMRADLNSTDDVESLSAQKHHRVSPAEFSEAVNSNSGTLYHFLPLNSEAMGEKLNSNHHRNLISGENKSKGTRTGGLDLNS